MAESSVEITKVPFMRITVLGASGAGKTSIISSYVNASVPSRYIKTDNMQVLYKKLEIDDEGEWHDVRKPIFLEIEDTPGSERGLEGDDGGAAQEPGSVPKIRKGSRVLVGEHKKAVMETFEDPKYKTRMAYKPAMDSMLGKAFNVKAIGKDGSYGLPSPDGSEGGVWNFPPGAVKLKVSMDLPIDQFLTLGEHAPDTFQEFKERQQYAADLQLPLSAYKRPIGNNEMDKTLTKNRMGYFICFDIADDAGDSLKEAMTVHGMLKKALAAKKNRRIKPHIWLVGCKADRTSMNTFIKMNRDSARFFSDTEEIPFYETAARFHHGVAELFEDMIQAIAARESLWTLEGVDEDEDAKQDGGCSVS